MSIEPVSFLPKAILFLALAAGIIAFIKLFLPVRESAREVSRPVSKTEARANFLGGLIGGGWLLFWSSGVIWTGRFGLFKHSGQIITPETHPFYFWITVGTVALLGFCFIAHSLRKLLRYRRRASVLKQASYLQ